MSNTRSATKVGLFVFVGLVLLAALMISFSKGTAIFKKTYRLELISPSVGGIKPRAAVMMAGVPVGSVESVRLTPDGKAVIITVQIQKQYIIRDDAIFTIDQAGFLGDQYIEVDPDKNAGKPLQDGATVKCEPPLNLLKVARGATEMLTRINLTISNINTLAENSASVFNRTTLENIRSEALTTLSNASETTASIKRDLPGLVSNVQRVVTRAHGLLDSAGEMVESNKAAVAGAVSNIHFISSNLTLFSTNLNAFSGQLSSWFQTNSPQISHALSNFQVASIEITNILSDVRTNLQAGRGIVGALLKDDALSVQTRHAITNTTYMADEIRHSFSNLNQHGLWWMLWKPKNPKTNATQETGWAVPRQNKK